MILYVSFALFKWPREKFCKRSSGDYIDTDGLRPFVSSNLDIVRARVPQPVSLYT